MQIFIGADHNGFLVKSHIISNLTAIGHHVIDCGVNDFNPTDDYPLVAFELATKILKAVQNEALGILLCKSGAGMAIAANKLRGIRAAEAFSIESATLARSHNHANILTLGTKWLLDETQLMSIIEAFINTEPSTEVRHIRRLQQIADQELANN